MREERILQVHPTGRRSTLRRGKTLVLGGSATRRWKAFALTRGLRAVGAFGAGAGREAYSTERHVTIKGEKRCKAIHEGIAPIVYV